MWAPISSAVQNLPTLSTNHGLDALRTPDPRPATDFTKRPVAIFVTVGIRHETEPVSCQGVGRGPATMTTAGKAMQVVVTCQQLSQTGQGGFGIRGGVGWGWACSTQPVQVTVEPQRAALALYPCPSGKDLSRSAGAGAPALSLPRGSCRVLAHGSWGPMAFCPFLRRHLGTGCLLVGDPGDLLPQIQARRSRVSWEAGCFLPETQGPEGLNIPQSSHGPDCPHPPHPSTETFQSHVNMCTKPFFF